MLADRHAGISIVDLVVAIAILSASIAESGKILAACSLLLTVLFLSGLNQFRYLLLVTLASWLAMHLLNYVSDVAIWSIDLFKICWLALFLVVLAKLCRREGRALLIACLLLLNTGGAFWLTSVVPQPVLPNRWLQETVFRFYASRLIRSIPPDQLLSTCKLVEYTGEDGLPQKIGECNWAFARPRRFGFL